jgi:hypothetical protein
MINGNNYEKYFALKLFASHTTTIQRITVFMSKEPVLRLARQALIALAVHK